MSAERDIVERLGEPHYIADDDHARTPDAVLDLIQHTLRPERYAAAAEITRLRALAQSPEDAEWLRKEATLWRASASFDATAEYKADRLEAIANRLSGVRE